MTRHALLAATILLAACDAPVAPNARTAPRAPSTAIVRNDRFEREAFTIDGCNGAPVAVDATFHEIVAVTFDQAGGYHVVIHRNIEGTGVSLYTGAEYVVSQVNNDSYTVGRGADEETRLVNFTLVSKGSEPNEVVEGRYHLTLTPDGEASSYHEGFVARCQG
jgi:hypothetical protein